MLWHSDYSLSSEPYGFHLSPRRTILGGFKMNGKTAAAWAQREFKLLAPPERQYELRSGLDGDDSTILKIINIKVAPYGAEFMRIGEGEKDLEWMIVTQSAPFNGYVGMDPRLIPQFQEGSREEYARGLLVEEGQYYSLAQLSSGREITENFMSLGFSQSDYEFTTVLY
ncbi:hypothetical protein BDQ12DRAFT_383333 [Crucibulum laeve]|uniref:Uncharacterized protein n=1 Tax=Crucibulum laeve TaxID=68775 RepID=A0A5C3LYU2_9AGAR|nr:hypothetical protein BDQ12DRAFT_383333 [Crucibulum laeve]